MVTRPSLLDDERVFSFMLRVTQMDKYVIAQEKHLLHRLKGEEPKKPKNRKVST